MLFGVLCGLAAAILQSLSYISSRHYTHSRGGGGGMALTILVHLWLAILAFPMLPLAWTAGIHWRVVMWPLMASAVLDFLGQGGQTVAIQRAEPSRVSPLLTMKVFLPAILTTIFGPPVGQVVDRDLSGWQWLAVALCVVAGVSIQRGGGGMRKSAMAAVIFTSLIFGISDWCIGLAIGGMLKTPGVSPFRASFLAESVLYSMTGVIGLVLCRAGWGLPPGKKNFTRAQWRDSFPYAGTWFLAMIFLFLAFGEIGVVLGTILQCTRSFITILIAAGLMTLGLEHIEPKQPAKVIFTRITAGVLMSVSISVYILRDPGKLWRAAERRPAHQLNLNSPSPASAAK